MIDNENRDWAFGWFEFQAELLLHDGKDIGARSPLRRYRREDALRHRGTERPTTPGCRGFNPASAAPINPQ